MHLHSCPLDVLRRDDILDAMRRAVQAGKVRVIASGGVGNIEHIRKLTTIGAWGAIVGRSLYEGTVDLREAIAVVQKANAR